MIYFVKSTFRATEPGVRVEIYETYEDRVRGRMLTAISVEKSRLSHWEVGSQGTVLARMFMVPGVLNWLFV